MKDKLPTEMSVDKKHDLDLGKYSAIKLCQANEVLREGGWIFSCWFVTQILHKLFVFETHFDTLQMKEGKPIKDHLDEYNYFG